MGPFARLAQVSTIQEENTKLAKDSKNTKGRFAPG